MNDPVELTGLAAGDYTVYVIGKNSAGVWQAEADATASKTWTVDPALARVRINEVLASNDSAVDHLGTFPDMIELSTTARARRISPAWVSATTPRGRSSSSPRARSSVPASIYCSTPTTNPAIPTFILALHQRRWRRGVSIPSSAQGGGLIDSVAFGPQIPNLSIGRVGHDGHWASDLADLRRREHRRRDGRSLDASKINQWLADGKVLFTDDFVELYNPDPLPVASADCSFTDNPVTQPAKHEIASLSFIAGGGYAVFAADDNGSDGPNHLGFKFAVDQEIFGLFDSAGQEIDKILHYSQTTDVSQGRSPDGGPVYSVLRPAHARAGQPGR